MMILIIAGQILPPIVILVALGVLLDRLFTIDLPTLSKVTFQVFVPALVMDKILVSGLSWGHMGDLALFALALIAVCGVMTLPFWLLTCFRQQAPVLTLGTLFFNAGNIGLPVADMAFGADGVAAMAIILMVQNLSSFTLGIWILERDRQHLGQILLGLLRIPVVHAILLALLLRQLQMGLPTALALPLGYCSDALIPVALLTLGVQFSRCRIGGHLLATALCVCARLLAAPLLAAALLLAFDFDPTTRGLCLCAAGLPVAVNVFIIANEYQHNAELAAQIVFWSSLLCCLTIPLLIAIGQGL